MPILPPSPADELLALRGEREHHLAALDALDVGLLVVAAGGTVLLSNRAYDRVLGGDAVPGPWSEGGSPVQRVLRQGTPVEQELLEVRRGGRTTWLSVTARPLRRPDEQQPYAVLATFTDVTVRRDTDRALAESEAHFRLLAENSTDVITRHSAYGTCLYASPALRDLLGRDPEELEDRQATDFVHGLDRAALVRSFHALMDGHDVPALRYRLSHVDGSWVWVETVSRLVRGDASAPELQSSTRDVTSRVATEQRLARLALGDALTGLANRAALLQHLEDLVAAGGAMALLFLDLDRFKVVNDSLGHSAGDELLRHVAGRLSGACRDGDLVARLGGDEFVVVAAGLDEAGAVQLAERVQQVLASPIGVAGHELVVTASIGVVVTEAGPGDDAEELLRDADASMYRAKAEGRARAVVWTPADTEGDAVERLTVEQELRVALETGQVAVHYQPQVELVGGRVVGVEALVRWAHPTRGLLLPEAFLQVADDTGLVLELGRQVLHAAAHQVAAWRSLPGHEGLGLAVDVSTQELLGTAHLEGLLDVLHGCGLPPGALTLEVRESVLLESEGPVVEALRQCALAGLCLALDGFGTGSSSLLHLRRVPVSVVKVDRELVAGLGHSRQDEAIVRALLSLSADLGLTCVAEGVEHDVQRDWLVAQGVDLAQGDLLHRPLPVSAVTALLGAAADLREPSGPGPLG